MADVTISELAGVVGVPVKKLLSQIKEAGLPHKKAKELISNEDKNALLLFLRRSHGDREATGAAPKKITLKRKTIGTLKAASKIHGRGKTVNVEVRKKRTYVKRSPVDEEPPLPELEAPSPDEEKKLDNAAIASEEIQVSEEEAKHEAAKEITQPEKPEQQEELRDLPAAPSADVPPSDAETGRAGKAGAKRKAQTKEDSDDPVEKKKTHLRNKAKAQAPKRHAKNIHVNDDFVLEGDDFDGISGRSRRGGGRKSKARLSAQQHAFAKPTE
ncbi:MAG: IF-2-associated domain-containing protein, partial [Pseudohongiellaceae bacterium]